MYVLVEFDNNDVDIIPSRWLKASGQAYWPHNMRPSKVSNAVLTKCAPCDDWKVYKVKELYRNESYSMVRQKLRRAEAYTDIASTADSDSEEEDVTRRSKRKRISKTFSSDSEIDMALTPQKKRTKKLVEKTAHLPTPPSSKLSQIGSFGQKRALSVSEGHSDSENLEVVSSQESSTQSTLEILPSVSDVSSQGALQTTPTTSKQTPRHETPLNLVSPNQARDLKLFTLLEKIRQEQSEMKDQLYEILGMLKKSTNSDIEVAIPENLKFPLQSVEEVEELETNLQDTSTFNGLVGFLSCLGGKNRADASRRVMKKLLSNELCNQYTWFGRKGKRAFGKLKLASVVQKTIHKTFKASLVEIEMDVREWFRTASDRDGGRKKRMKKKEANSNMTQEQLDLPTDF